MGLLDSLFNRQPKPGRPLPLGDDDFKEKVLGSKIPVVIQFYSNTCKHCHVMGGLLKELGPEYADRLQIFTVNVNFNPKTAQALQIQSVPTVVMFRDGKPVDAIRGVIPLNPLREKLDALVAES
ncbi:MAG: thioredoxin family protein [bacterium]|nr:thioredoxin family protein [bacterium]